MKMDRDDHCGARVAFSKNSMIQILIPAARKPTGRQLAELKIAPCAAKVGGKPVSRAAFAGEGFGRADG